MEVKTGYKKTDIGIIPNDWNNYPLLNSAILKARIGWQGLTTAEYKLQGDYFLVTGTEFNDGYIDWDTCFYVGYERYKQDKNIQLKTNDVLVTKDGTIGKVAFINLLPKLATLNSGVFVIRPINDFFDSKFFYYLLRSKYFENFLNKLAAGSTISHLYQKDFIHFRFPLPPTLEEQCSIATALSDTDELISSLDKLITKKRNIKQAAMQQLLTGKKRLPGFSGEWEVKKLGEVAEVVGGGTPNTTVNYYWNGDINWFTPTEIGMTKYINQSRRKISKKGFLSCSANMLPKGAILLTSRAGIGDVGILINESCTNQGFQSLIVRDGYYNEFLYYLTKILTNVFTKNASGSTFLEISPNKIRQIEVNIPKYEEQISIAKVLSDIDSEIDALEQKRDKYKAIKQGMMQQLLTGKIRLLKPAVN